MHIAISSTRRISSRKKLLGKGGWGGSGRGSYTYCVRSPSPLPPLTDYYVFLDVTEVSLSSALKLSTVLYTVHNRYYLGDYWLLAPYHKINEYMLLWWHCPWYTLIPMHQALFWHSSCSDNMLFRNVKSSPDVHQLPRCVFADAWTSPDVHFPNARSWTFPDIHLPDALTPLPTCNFRRAKLFQ